MEDDTFWDGLAVEKSSADVFHDIKLIVYPTYVEHQPRLLLRAIGRRIPIITTQAAGLEPSDIVTIVNAGNYNELKAAVLSKLHVSSVVNP